MSQSSTTTDITVAALITLYGCGPNIVIGTCGALFEGVRLINAKVRQIWAKTQLQFTHAEAMKTNLQGKIRRLDKFIHKHLKAFYLFMISTIPLIGPWGTIFLM